MAPPIHDITKAGFALLILQPPAPQGWDDKQVPYTSSFATHTELGIGSYLEMISHICCEGYIQLLSHPI